MWERPATNLPTATILRPLRGLWWTVCPPRVSLQVTPFSSDPSKRSVCARRGSNMRRIALMALPLALLSACDRIPGTNAHSIREARSAIASQMRDPSSAQFRSDRVLVDDGKWFVCGEVNAKNGVGGYTGFAPYAYAIDPKQGEVLPIGQGDEALKQAAMSFPGICLKGVMIPVQNTANF